MKIAVYTIALNEEKHVQRWYESVKDADYIFIGDTGSNDKTVEIAQSLGITCIDLNMEKFRFDEARNLTLAAIPKDVDYCISLDMDEVLQPDWRNLFEELCKNNPTKIIFKIDVIENNNYKYSGIVERGHKKNCYKWALPVHELLVPLKNVEENIIQTNIGIAHYPDMSKDRANYSYLIADAYKDDENDPRTTYHLARYLYMIKDYIPAAKYFKKYLTFQEVTSKPHRAEVYRYLAVCEENNVIFWLLKSIKEDPTRREPYVNMAQVFVAKKDWTSAKEYLNKAFAIKKMPTDYVNEDFAWGKFINDLNEQVDLEIQYENSSIYNSTE